VVPYTLMDKNTFPITVIGVELEQSNDTIQRFLSLRSPTGTFRVEIPQMIHDRHVAPILRIKEFLEKNGQNVDMFFKAYDDMNGNSQEMQELRNHIVELNNHVDRLKIHVSQVEGQCAAQRDRAIEAEKKVHGAR